MTSFSVNNETLAYIKQQQYEKGQNNIGKPEPTYLMSDHEEWVEEQFPLNHTLAPEVYKSNDLFRAVHDTCMDVIYTYGLADEPRPTGPEEGERNYAAHGLRVGRIVVDELGFRNPYMYAHAVLHDVIEVLHKRSQTPEDALLAVEEFKDYFNRKTEAVFGTPHNVLAHLPDSLEEFYYRDLVYDLLAEEVVDNPEIGTLIDHGLHEGFTPKSYSEFRAKVLEKYMYERKAHPEKGRYPDLRELIEFMKFNITDDTYSADTPDGLAVMMTMVAQAADNYRYPKENTNRYYCMQGIDVICNLLPMVRGLNHQAAIRLLYDIPARAFMPEQWKACREALKALSQREKDEEGNGAFFDNQAKQNMKILHRVVGEMTTFLEQNGVAARYVDSTELESRKIQLLAGERQGPLLDDDEFSIVGPSKKTTGSIFTKLFLEYAVKGRFDEWVGGTTDEEKQAALAEEFKNPDTWVEALSRSPDTIRATVVLGNELSRIYCYGDAERNIPRLSEMFKFYFPEDAQYPPYVDSVNPDRTITINEEGREINLQPPYHRTLPDYFRPIHHTAERRISEKESIESRINPYQQDEDGNMYFEDHYVMQLKKSLRDNAAWTTINLPFELHVESVHEHYLDELDKEAHILYKFRYILPQMNADEQAELLRDYRQVLLLMSWCMYREALSGQLLDPSQNPPVLHFHPADYWGRFGDWILERQGLS